MAPQSYTRGGLSESLFKFLTAVSENFSRLNAMQYSPEQFPNEICTIPIHFEEFSKNSYISEPPHCKKTFWMIVQNSIKEAFYLMRLSLLLKKCGRGGGLMTPTPHLTPPAISACQAYKYYALYLHTILQLCSRCCQLSSIFFDRPPKIERVQTAYQQLINKRKRYFVRKRFNLFSSKQSTLFGQMRNDTKILSQTSFEGSLFNRTV
jgi:hypothetical protein